MIEKRTFNPNVFKTIGDAKTIVDDKNEDGKTTSTILWESGEFTRAVFKLKWEFDADKYPSKKNNWLLNENPW